MKALTESDFDPCPQRFGRGCDESRTRMNPFAPGEQCLLIVRVEVEDVLQN
jgi:hypothetical protein